MRFESYEVIETDEHVNVRKSYLNKVQLNHKIILGTLNVLNLPSIVTILSVPFWGILVSYHNWISPDNGNCKKIFVLKYT